MVPDHLQGIQSVVEVGLIYHQSLSGYHVCACNDPLPGIQTVIEVGLICHHLVVIVNCHIQSFPKGTSYLTMIGYGTMAGHKQ